MLPECRALPDFHRTLINDGQIQEYWFSVLWEHPFGNSCLDFFKALDHALRSHDRRSELFFQAPRSRHHGSSRSQITRRRDADGPGPAAAGRHQRTAGLFGGILRRHAGGFEQMFMDGCYKATH